MPPRLTTASSTYLRRCRISNRANQKAFVNSLNCDTYQALPQLGSSRSTVVCKAMRTTGSSSAFSSRRGRSFLTLAFALESPLRKRCCRRNREHMYSAGLVLSKHSSQFCECQGRMTSYDGSPTGSGKVAGLSKVDAISFSILNMVMCIFRSISVVVGAGPSCSAVASRL